MWSSKRPVVPIKTWLLPSSLCFCNSKSRPPVTARTLISLSPVIFFSSLATCWDNSRVGVITSACTYGLVVSIFSTKGTKNAKVLPVPVCALAITSLPAYKAGIACSCTGMGFLIPILVNCSTVWAQTFSASKPLAIFHTSLRKNLSVKILDIVL